MKIVILLSLFFSKSTFSQELYFKVENRTGWRCDIIQVAPNEDTKWGADILPSEYFYNRETIDVIIPKNMGKSCYFDMRCEFSNGDAWIYEDFNACEISKIILKPRGIYETL